MSAAADAPIRVGVVGAGFMARGLVRHIESSIPGIRVVAVQSRTVSRFADLAQFVGWESPPEVDSASSLDRVVGAGGVAYSQSLEALTGADHIDLVVDATGALEFGAQVAAAAVDGGKQVVSLNAELDATVGPVLTRRAAAAGLVRSAADGDQPAVQARLAQFARSRGFIPRVLGNIKGLHDVRRNPDTQAAFAARWGQNPRMVTSFADGTKVNFEQALVANSFGFTVSRDGMAGRDFSGHVDELVGHYTEQDWGSSPGVIDYVVGARPAPGVFCLAELADHAQRDYAALFKIGKGPLYSFYAPYHLCHLEVPATIDAVMRQGTGVLTATGRPTVSVVTVSKCALRAGTVLDGLGGFHTYGLARPFDTSAVEAALPMGLSEGCVLTRDIPADTVVSLADVTRPAGRLIDALYDDVLALAESSA